MGVFDLGLLDLDRDRDLDLDLDKSRSLDCDLGLGGSLAPPSSVGFLPLAPFSGDFDLEGELLELELSDRLGSLLFLFGSISLPLLSLAFRFSLML